MQHHSWNRPIFPAVHGLDSEARVSDSSPSAPPRDDRDADVDPFRDDASLLAGAWVWVPGCGGDSSLEKGSSN